MFWVPKIYLEEIDYISSYIKKWEGRVNSCWCVCFNNLFKDLDSFFRAFAPLQRPASGSVLSLLWWRSPNARRHKSWPDPTTQAGEGWDSWPRGLVPSATDHMSSMIPPTSFSTSMSQVTNRKWDTLKDFQKIRTLTFWHILFLQGKKYFPKASGHKNELPN